MAHDLVDLEARLGKKRWQEVIERWQALPLDERTRLSGRRIALNVAESMAFAGEPVDLKMLDEEHARRGEQGRPLPSAKPKVGPKPSSARK